MGAWNNVKQSCREWWSDTKGFIAVVCSFFTVALFVVGLLQAQSMMDRYPRIDWGSIADAFAAIGTLLAVIVALWQSMVIRRQAKEDAADAAERLEAEITAANQRTRSQVAAAEDRFKREQELTSQRHNIEMDAQREGMAAAEDRFRREQELTAQRHETEMDAQREVARVQRVHLREQEFKLALIRVSKAASAYTHTNSRPCFPKPNSSLAFRRGKNVTTRSSRSPKR